MGRQSMIIDIKKSVSFSGHRILKPAPDDLFASLTQRTRDSEGGSYSAVDFKTTLRRELLQKIEALYQKGYTTYICGMAEGFDLLAAECVVALQERLPELRLIAAIPFPEQSQNYSAEDRILYNKILQLVDDSFLVCQNYRPDCFHRRNDFMVDNSSVLISFYNGSKGGTAYTVKRAIREGLQVINLP